MSLLKGGSESPRRGNVLKMVLPLALYYHTNQCVENLWPDVTLWQVGHCNQVGGLVQSLLKGRTGLLLYKITAFLGVAGVYAPLTTALVNGMAIIMFSSFLHTEEEEKLLTQFGAEYVPPTRVMCPS